MALLCAGPLALVPTAAATFAPSPPLAGQLCLVKAAAAHGQRGGHRSQSLASPDSGLGWGLRPPGSGAHPLRGTAGASPI